MRRDDQDEDTVIFRKHKGGDAPFVQQKHENLSPGDTYLQLIQRKSINKSSFDYESHFVQNSHIPTQPAQPIFHPHNRKTILQLGSKDTGFSEGVGNEHGNYQSYPNTNENEMQESTNRHPSYLAHNSHLPPSETTPPRYHPHDISNLPNSQARNSHFKSPENVHSPRQQEYLSGTDYGSPTFDSPTCRKYVSGRSSAEGDSHGYHAKLPNSHLTPSETTPPSYHSRDISDLPNSQAGNSNFKSSENVHSPRQQEYLSDTDYGSHTFDSPTCRKYVSGRSSPEGDSYRYHAKLPKDENICRQYSLQEDCTKSGSKHRERNNERKKHNSLSVSCCTIDESMKQRCRRYMAKLFCAKGTRCLYLHRLPKEDGVICKLSEAGICYKTASNCRYLHRNEDLNEQTDKDGADGLHKENDTDGNGESIAVGSLGALLTLLRQQQQHRDFRGTQTFEKPAVRRISKDFQCNAPVVHTEFDRSLQIPDGALVKGSSVDPFIKNVPKLPDTANKLKQMESRPAWCNDFQFAGSSPIYSEENWRNSPRLEPVLQYSDEKRSSKKAIKSAKRKRSQSIESYASESSETNRFPKSLKSESTERNRTKSSKRNRYARRHSSQSTYSNSSNSSKTSKNVWSCKSQSTESDTTRCSKTNKYAKRHRSQSIKSNSRKSSEIRCAKRHRSQSIESNSCKSSKIRYVKRHRSQSIESNSSKSETSESSQSYRSQSSETEYFETVKSVRRRSSQSPERNSSKFFETSKSSRSLKSQSTGSNTFKSSKTSESLGSPKSQSTGNNTSNSSRTSKSLGSPKSQSTGSNASKSSKTSQSLGSPKSQSTESNTSKSPKTCKSLGSPKSQSTGNNSAKSSETSKSSGSLKSQSMKDSTSNSSKSDILSVKKGKTLSTVDKGKSSKKVKTLSTVDKGKSLKKVKTLSTVDKGKSLKKVKTLSTVGKSKSLKKFKTKRNVNGGNSNHNEDSEDKNKETKLCILPSEFKEIGIKDIAKNVDPELAVDRNVSDDKETRDEKIVKDTKKVKSKNGKRNVSEDMYFDKRDDHEQNKTVSSTMALDKAESSNKKGKTISNLKNVKKSKKENNENVKELAREHKKSAGRKGTCNKKDEQAGTGETLDGVENHRKRLFNDGQVRSKSVTEMTPVRVVSSPKGEGQVPEVKTRKIIYSGDKDSLSKDDINRAVCSEGNSSATNEAEEAVGLMSQCVKSEEVNDHGIDNEVLSTNTVQDRVNTCENYTFEADVSKKKADDYSKTHEGKSGDSKKVSNCNSVSGDTTYEKLPVSCIKSERNSDVDSKSHYPEKDKNIVSEESIWSSKEKVGKVNCSKLNNGENADRKEETVFTSQDLLVSVSNLPEKSDDIDPSTAAFEEGGNVFKKSRGPVSDAEIKLHIESEIIDDGYGLPMYSKTTPQELLEMMARVLEFRGDYTSEESFSQLWTEFEETYEACTALELVHNDKSDQFILIEANLRILLTCIYLDEEEGKKVRDALLEHWRAEPNLKDYRKRLKMNM